MLNIESIIANLETPGKEAPQLAVSHFEDHKWEEEGYLISSALPGIGDEFVAASLKHLAKLDYVDNDEIRAIVDKGLFSEPRPSYLSELLQRFQPVLDEATLDDLEGIKRGMLIINDWNRRMGYVETAKNCYFYAWDTTA